MVSTALIRLATVEDADSIGMIHRVGQRLAAVDVLPEAAFATTAAQHGAEWRHWLRLQALGRASGFVLVADTRGGVGGFLCAVPPRSPWGEGAWTIRHLYIFPAYQGQGLDRRLEEAAVSRLRATGAKRVERIILANDVLVTEGVLATDGGKLCHRRWTEIGEETLILCRTVVGGVRYGRDLTDGEASVAGKGNAEKLQSLAHEENP